MSSRDNSHRESSDTYNPYSRRSNLDDRREREPPRRYERPQQPREPQRYEREPQRGGYDRDRRSNYRNDYRDRGDDGRYSRDRESQPRYPRDNYENRDSRDGYRDRRYDSRNHDRRANFPSRPAGRDRHREPEPTSTLKKYTEEELRDAKPIEAYERAGLWDKIPEGFESVPAGRAKASGMFPAPGVVNKLADIKKLLTMDTNAHTMSPADESLLEPAHSKAARRCVVTESQSEVPRKEEIVGFLQEYIFSVSGSQPKIVTVPVPSEKELVLEFTEPDFATLVVALSGRKLEEIDTTLTVTRPGGYVVFEEKMEEGKFPDNPRKLVLADIPSDYSLLDVKDTLSSVGALEAFTLITDKETSDSKGLAFLQFEDLTNIEEKILAVNELKVGETPVRCFRACEGPVQNQKFTYETMVEMVGSEAPNAAQRASSALVFLNAVAVSDLAVPRTYEEVEQDFRSECGKYGAVEELIIPRPSPTYSAGDDVSPEVGNVYVKFDSADNAIKALEALSGRLFAGRTVVGSFFDGKDFDRRLL